MSNFINKIKNVFAKPSTENKPADKKDCKTTKCEKKETVKTETKKEVQTESKDK